MRRRRMLAILVGALAIMVVAAPEASARRRIPIILNVGDDVVEVAPLPEFLAKGSLSGESLDGWKLGWKFSRFGVLWADVFTWDRELVLVKGNSYAELPEEIRADLAPTYPFSQGKRGWWPKHGLKVFIGMGLLMLVIQYLGNRSERAGLTRGLPGES